MITPERTTDVVHRKEMPRTVLNFGGNLKGGNVCTGHGNRELHLANRSRLQFICETMKKMYAKYFDLGITLIEKYEQIWVNLTDSEISDICDEKLGMPKGTGCNNDNLLRMIKFDTILDALMKPVLEVEGQEPNLQAMTEFRFYQHFLKEIIDAEYNFLLGLKFGWKPNDENTSVYVSTKVGSLLLGMESKRRLKLPMKLRVTSFKKLQHMLKLFIEFINERIENRGEVSLGFRPSPRIVLEYLQQCSTERSTDAGTITNQARKIEDHQKKPSLFIYSKIHWRNIAILKMMMIHSLLDLDFMNKKTILHKIH